MQINDVVISFGHKEVFKKRGTQALSLKTDSFVVEANVHFPTDYNLLWDSSPKALDTIEKFKNKTPNYKLRLCYKNTRFNTYKIGDIVNLEFDVVGKYVAKMMEVRL